MANLTYDKEKGVYELDIRMFIDDFLVAVGTTDQTDIPFGSITTLPSKREVRSYVSEHFSLKFNNAPVPLKVDKIKMEEITIFVTLKVETGAHPDDLHSIEIVDSIYVDTFINQRNVVHISLPGRKRSSHLFNHYQRQKLVEMK